MSLKRSCILCGSKDLTVIGEHQDFKNINIKQCNNCKLITTYPYPNEKILNEYYNSSYSTKRVKGIDHNNYGIYDRRALNQYAFIKSSSYGHNESDNFFKNKLILEIGCGIGSLLKIFEENGAKVFGVDSDKEIIKIAKKRLSTSAELVSDIFNISTFGEKKFDVVLLSHVLEHIIDPTVFMKKIFSLLKDDGIVFVEVPNNNIKRINKMINRGYSGTGHLTFFDVNSIEYLIKSCNAKVIAKKTFGDNINNIYVPYGNSKIKNLKIIKTINMICGDMICPTKNKIYKLLLNNKENDSDANNGIYIRLICKID